MILPIRTYGDPMLRAVAKPFFHDVEREKGLVDLIRDMTDTMTKNDGIGLAAPQVGVGYRVITLGFAPYSMINPVIVARSGRWLDEEGCLSIPGIYKRIYRPTRIVVTWQGISGGEQSSIFIGRQARVILHEVDHLDGVLFIDHLSGTARKAINAQLARIEESNVQAG